jgi:hypothetical protein
MDHAGSNINLTISSCSLALTVLETGQVIAKHEMPRISFASGGDTVSIIIFPYLIILKKIRGKIKKCKVSNCFLLHVFLNRIIYIL